jgi:hypothetical protein
LAYLSTLTEFLGLEYVTVQNENEWWKDTENK